MNTQHWINHFEANTRLNHDLKLPESPCELPDHIRAALSRSIATFQLGESGGGTRLRQEERPPSARQAARQAEIVAVASRGC